MLLPALSIRQPNVAGIAAFAGRQKQQQFQNRLAQDQGDRANRLLELKERKYDDDQALTGRIDQARGDYLGGDKSALAKLARIDPDGAAKIQDIVSQASTEQREQLARQNEELAQMAVYVSGGKTPEDKQARWDQVLGGLPPEAAASVGTQFSQDALDLQVARIMSTDEVLKALEGPDAPSGFRSADGGLEFIPGGPGDPAYKGDVADATRAPDKPTAMEAKIAEIIDSLGADRATAAGIATGAIRVVTDPMTNQPFAVNLADGTTKALNAQAAAVSPAPQTPGDQPKSLWELSEKSTGIVSGAQELFSDVAGQVSDEFVIEDVVMARQQFRSSQNQFIRAMSINPRFPVGEINRLKEETKIEPSIWKSQGSLRARMKAVDIYLRGLLRDETEAGNNASLPLKTRQASAQSAKDIGNFLNSLGVPQDGESALQGPSIGTIEGGYRFKGGDPADPNSWEAVQ